MIYKNDFQLPVAWQRRFNRLAAVLEGTDKEFSLFVADKTRYQKQRKETTKRKSKP